MELVRAMVLDLEDGIGIEGEGIAADLVMNGLGW